jgi:hypothetical protein
MAGRTEDRSLRPDGVHYDIPAFGSFSEEWFGPELERIWTEWWTERSARP